MVAKIAHFRLYMVTSAVYRQATCAPLGSARQAVPGRLTLHQRIFCASQGTLLPVDPTDLRIFGQVAKTRSYRKSAERLNMAASSVSRHIAALERELGVSLLHRNTRCVSLTEPGRRLFAHWQSIADAIELAVDDVRGMDEMPAGTLYVSLPSSLGAALMPALASRFLPEWRDLRLTVDLRERCIDLVGSGFDAAIRVARTLPDSELAGRRLAVTPCVLAASPEYLRKRGHPRFPSDLKRHDCLAIGYTGEHRVAWQFVGADGPFDVRLKPVFAANSDVTLILAACSGAGIIYTSELLIASELRLGYLAPITLEGVEQCHVGVYALYPKPNPPSKVRLFVDFVERCIPDILIADRRPLPRKRIRNESGHPW